jgi:hypothetical protein
MYKMEDHLNYSNTLLMIIVVQAMNMKVT